MALRRNLIFAVLALAGWISPAQVEAQFLGYTSQQSTAQLVWTNQNANAVSSTLSNIGQSSHYLTVCNTAFVGVVSLEASTDSTYANPVTLVAGNYGTLAADTGCHVLQAGGYYPAVRARVKGYSSGSASVFYTGIGGPIAPAPSGISSSGPTAPPVCDTNAGPSSVAQNTTTASLGIGGTAGQAITVCSITLSFSAATTTGQVQFVTGAGPSCTAPTALYTLNITASTPQIVHLVGAAGGLLHVPAGNGLCITTTTVTASTLVDTSYAQISQ